MTIVLWKETIFPCCIFVNEKKVRVLCWARSDSPSWVKRLPPTNLNIIFISCHIRYDRHTVLVPSAGRSDSPSWVEQQPPAVQTTCPHHPLSRPQCSPSDYSLLHAAKTKHSHHVVNVILKVAQHHQQSLLHAAKTKRSHHVVNVILKVAQHHQQSFLHAAKTKHSHHVVNVILKVA